MPVLLKKGKLKKESAMPEALSREELKLMDAYWCAAIKQK
jgi:hypothetical protein